MKTKINTILYWSLNFTQDFEDCDLYEPSKSSREDAIQVLRKMFETKTNAELAQSLELWDYEKEEVDDEPDWDTLPGGKDY
jgi:hypothetical protein